MNNIVDQIKQLQAKLKRDLDKTDSLESVERVRIQYLGKKGVLPNLMTSISGVEQAQRARVGQELNQAKQAIAKQIAQKQQEFTPNLDDMTAVDLSTPGLPLASLYGHHHPTSLVLKQTYQIFTELGFAIVDGPEIESDWYNFEVLNQPPEHPARDTQDTFYIKDEKKSRKFLPRTQTSAMQVRFMEENKPPFKIIVPGKVFRNEDEDRTHSWSFYQIEGMVVGENVSLADLKGTMLHIVQRMLGPDAQIRLRPSYFPYTEPSIEVDAKMGDEWLELGGAGMVHPQVLKKGGIDPEKYTGFAFGWGAERIAVIKFGLTDLRKLWRPNLHFLEEF